MKRARAAVVGGGFGGLLAARALAEHFDEVVVVERDLLGEEAELRKGVPQAPHLHGFLKRGQLILESFFPGLLDELCAAGAQPVTFGREIRWYHYDGWKAQCDHGVDSIFMTRPFLEAGVRRRVRRLSNVRFLSGHKAVALLSSGDESSVVGLRYREAKDEGEERVLDADLVVDCGGRGSQALKWLEALGYGTPEVSELKIHLGYSTCAFKRPTPSPVPWRGMLVASKGTRAGVIMPVEGDRWICSAAGVLHDYPPGDLQGFIEFLGTLPQDAIHRLVKDAEPVTDVQTTRFQSSRWTHFERMPRFPRGYLVLGDAVACYNPMYGQGMTIAAIHAELLKDAVRTHGHDADRLSLRYRRKVADAAREAWSVSSGEDYRFPEVEGRRPPGYTAIKWYMDRVRVASKVDPRVCERFLHVAQMVSPFPTLLSPPFALRVMRAVKRAALEPV